MKKKYLFIAGARPQYVKLAALQRAFEDFTWWHTGQHPDMSESFWTPLGLKNPSKTFTYGAFGALLDDLETALKAHPPDRVLVVGDTNSALAGALAAHRLGIPVAHVEAGLRSFDNTMPEERNRRLIDTASDLWFCTEQAAVDNLLREGADPSGIHLVGNVMIDTLSNAECGMRNAECFEWGMRNAECGMGGEPYILATFHRPSNVDTEEGRAKLEVLLERAAAQANLVFITHPRYAALAPTDSTFRIPHSAFRTRIIPHSNYHEFLGLLLGASVVLTDSGGVQDECAFLRKPCVTFRANTERPVTVSCGSNVLCDDPFLAVGLIRKALNGCWGEMTVPPLWDGGSAKRIFELL